MSNGKWKSKGSGIEGLPGSQGKSYQKSVLDAAALRVHRWIPRHSESKQLLFTNGESFSKIHALSNTFCLSSSPYLLSFLLSQSLHFLLLSMASSFPHNWKNLQEISRDLRTQSRIKVRRMSPRHKRNVCTSRI